MDTATVMQLVKDWGVIALSSLAWLLVVIGSLRDHFKLTRRLADSLALRGLLENRVRGFLTEPVNATVTDADNKELDERLVEMARWLEDSLTDEPEILTARFPVYERTRIQLDYPYLGMAVTLTPSIEHYAPVEDEPEDEEWEDEPEDEPDELDEPEESALALAERQA